MSGFRKIKLDENMERENWGEVTRLN